MNNLLIVNIKQIVGLHQTDSPLRGSELHQLGAVENAFLIAKDGKIDSWGLMSNLPLQNYPILDAKDGFIYPAYCDSHTHLVFAASREAEMIMRNEGKSYEQIASEGGGILNSADKLRKMSESELFDHSYKRFKNIQQLGTGAVEIKSGYGLDFDSEMKMLRVIRRLKETNEIPVKATFLGAHAFPREFKKMPHQYVDLILNKMIPFVVDHGLADFIDVFCDRGFFNVEQTDQILQAAAKYGLMPKIHANELGVTGGVQVGVKNHAISVDHLEEMDVDAIQVLASSNTIGTMLPGCAFFLGIPFSDATAMINANCILALASDYNPGTAPSGNMSFIWALACIKMKMDAYAALNACTFNGAHAMQCHHLVGSIQKGKLANLILTYPIPSLTYIPYSFGETNIRAVIQSGKLI